MYFYYSSYLFESRPLNWSKWLANLDLVTEFVTKTIILLDTVYLHLTCLLSISPSQFLFEEGMDQDHCRGSMDPVHTSGPWTRSKMEEGVGAGGGGSPYVLSSSSMECNICVSQLPLVTRIMPLRKLPVFFINRYLCFLRTILAINRNKKLFYLKFLCTSLNLHLISVLSFISSWLSFRFRVTVATGVIPQVPQALEWESLFPNQGSSLVAYLSPCLLWSQKVNIYWRKFQISSRNTFVC